jgi:hypothetical protein
MINIDFFAFLFYCFAFGCLIVLALIGLWEMFVVPFCWRPVQTEQREDME